MRAKWARDAEGRKVPASERHLYGDEREAERHERIEQERLRREAVLARVAAARRERLDALATSGVTGAALLSFREGGLHRGDKEAPPATVKPRVAPRRPSCAAKPRKLQEATPAAATDKVERSRTWALRARGARSRTEMHRAPDAARDAPEAPGAVLCRRAAVAVAPCAVAGRAGWAEEAAATAAAPTVACATAAAATAYYCCAKG